MLTRLALLNLWRKPWRTLLSMGSVIAGVGVIILGQGFIGGLDENIIRAEVDSISGHVLVRPAEYPQAGLQHPTDGLFAVTPALSAALDENSVAWTARTLFVPYLTHGSDTVRVRAIAFDPKTDAAVFPRDTWRVRGTVPENAEDGILVSSGVRKLLAIPAEGPVEVTLETRTAAGAANALRLPVSGEFTVGNPVIDKLGILMTEDLARTLLLSDGRVSHVVARLARRDDALSVAASLPLPEATEVTTWVAETKDMLDLQKIRRRALNILAVCLLGMAATGIANTVLMAAYERIREIGTLRAMGLTRKGVVALFVTEGAFIGVLGSIVSASLAGSYVYRKSQLGFDLTAALENASGGNIPISTMLYLQFSPPIIAGAMAFGVVVAVLASIYPAWVASSMPPADAVRAD